MEKRVEVLETTVEERHPYILEKLVIHDADIHAMKRKLVNL